MDRISISMGHDISQFASRFALHSPEERRQLFASFLTFLTPFLERYVLRNNGLPPVSLDAVVTEMRDVGTSGSAASARYLSAFDKLMFDADDTDLWYDFMTQNALFCFRDAARLALGRGNDTDVLLRSVETVSNVFLELHNLEALPSGINDFSSFLRSIIDMSTDEVRHLGRTCLERCSDE